MLQAGIVGKNKGVVRTKGDIEAATSHFKAALRLRPDFAGARDNLDKAMELRAN